MQNHMIQPIQLPSMRQVLCVCALISLVSCAGPARADFEYASHTGRSEDGEAQLEDDGGSVIGAILCYLPNRIFDLLDIVRARVRVGPGLAVGVRATELADVFVGGYTSLYVGLPGPRGRRALNLPVGFDTNGGIEVGPADLTAEDSGGVHYGAAEIGLGAQVAMVGVDVGFDALEVVDFIAGFLFLDFMDDDL